MSCRGYVTRVITNQYNKSWHTTILFSGNFQLLEILYSRKDAIIPSTFDLVLAEEEENPVAYNGREGIHLLVYF